MRKLLFVALVLIGHSMARADNVDLAWKLVIQIESNSGTHPRTYETWKGHNDLGIAQITPILVKDVNRILKSEVFTLEMRVNDYLSRLMFEVYCNHYAKGGSVEKLCRLWHRGPSKKRQCDAYGDRYWNRARKEM